ncbi:MAG TPA: class I SAM-dependent methyltransferase [Spongiibacteraceae bacterium]|jgi:ubiquinone/menaquinone biosynthesis C-methylase UbiE|nr:class I SAM-dependent methyltransferase [Spongiibacteraceae bacterium]HUH36541.1 class I SAM-dependent methyltransferase [Spongiibacteraceae bacterium]
MGFYADKVLPHVINCACGSSDIMDQRRQVVPQATGEVLEVGMGSGLNLSLYDPAKVTRVWGLEPSEGMRAKARRNLARSPVPVEWLDLPGEQIPLPNQSIDTVVLTFTLCTIPDWHTALRQMHRVLKPTGRLLFCEHGRSPEAGVQKWQDRINPMWRKVAGGCNINRPMDRYIEDSGFRIEALHTEYMAKGPKIAGYMYRGYAVRA